MAFYILQLIQMSNIYLHFLMLNIVSVKRIGGLTTYTANNDSSFGISFFIINV